MARKKHKTIRFNSNGTRTITKRRTFGNVTLVSSKRRGKPTSRRRSSGTRRRTPASYYSHAGCTVHHRTPDAMQACATRNGAVADPISQPRTSSPGTRTTTLGKVGLILSVLAFFAIGMNGHWFIGFIVGSVIGLIAFVGGTEPIGNAVVVPPNPEANENTDISSDSLIQERFIRAQNMTLIWASTLFDEADANSNTTVEIRIPIDLDIVDRVQENAVTRGYRLVKTEPIIDPKGDAVELVFQKIGFAEPDNETPPEDQHRQIDLRPLLLANPPVAAMPEPAESENTDTIYEARTKSGALCYHHGPCTVNHRTESAAKRCTNDS